MSNLTDSKAARPRPGGPRRMRPAGFHTMQMRLNQRTRTSSVKHLRKNDPVLRDVISAVGPFTLRRRRSRFQMLVRSIISQQISVSAATSIRTRLFALVDNQVDADQVAALSDDQFRSAGVSPQKVRYLRDLSERVASGRLQLSTIGRLSDDAVIERLEEVKGIGYWTAQMFLIFALGRLDVLPFGDVGIQNAIQQLYDLKERPDRETIERIAEPWRPYSSVASWYCWRSLEVTPG